MRLGAAAAAACLGLLLPSLVATPAAASGPTARVAFEPLGHSGKGAAGVCLLYRMVAQDAAFEDTITQPGQAFASVTLTEQGDLEKQDVDFCTLSGKGDDFRRAPRYFNAGTGTTGTAMYYNAGATLTPEEAGNPEKARQDVPPATSSSPLGRPDKAAKEPSTSSAGANNFLSFDQAVIGFDPEAGGFVFGVVSSTEGAARISGFLDHNGDGAMTSEVPGVRQGDVEAQNPVDVAFTPGGPPYSMAVADAARTVVASPKNVTAVAGDASGASLLATVTNAEGQPLAGVRPRLTAEGGPNTAGTTPTWAASCAASDGTGRSACTYWGQLPGTDQVAVHVNQTTNGGTAQRDESEPFDLVEVTLERPSTGTASPSATPSASATRSASATPTAPPSAAPSTPTAEPSAAPSTRTAEPSAEPTPPAEPQCVAARVTVERAVIAATSDVRVLVRATPNAVVRLLAYSRPSTTYRVVREGTTSDEGATVFTVRPLTNTRLLAEEPGCPASVSEVVQVRSAVSLGATRLGPRDFAFRGRVIPTRPGQLVSLYRTTFGGRQVLAGQARVDRNGIWSLRKTFAGTGRFGFVARTGADVVNGAGTSPVRTVDVR